MGTEVLRPHDYFVERIWQSPCRRRNNNNNNNNNNNYCPNPNFTNSNANRSSRKQPKREPTISKRSVSVDDVSRIPKNHHNHHHHHRNASAYATTNHHLVMEKVTILRRGESLDSKIKSMEAEKKIAVSDLVVTGTDRLGPDCPEMVPKKLRIVDLRSPGAGKPDVYAGSAFAVSPSPSSLPLPSFSKKKYISVDDSATRDLRRLLRLEF